MRKKMKAAALAAAGVAAIAGTAGIADAATHHAKKHAKKHAAAKRTTKSGAETALTGDTKTKAEAAALAAVPGGTVRRSSTEDPNDASGAAYEVHVTKSDGSEVQVLEDASFKVLAVNADTHAGHPGDGRGPVNETELTGDTKTKAEAAALAAVPGGTVWRSSTEGPNDASGAAYEVHVTKSDGSEVEVLEDAGFNVLHANASPQAAPY